MKTFQDLYIYLNGYNVEDFIGNLTKQCNSNWKRAIDREENAKLFLEKAFAFEHIENNNLPNAGLTLFEYKNNIWHVPNIVPLKTSQLTIDEYNKLLGDFNDSIVKPAIINTPIKIELTKDKIVFEDIVGETAANALNRFSTLANKRTLNLHPYDKKRWFEFLIAVQDAKEKPSFDLLKSTLMEQGWSDESAYELATQFDNSQELLDFIKQEGGLKHAA